MQRFPRWIRSRKADGQGAPEFPGWRSNLERTMTEIVDGHRPLARRSRLGQFKHMMVVARLLPCNATGHRGAVDGLGLRTVRDCRRSDSRRDDRPGG